MKAKMNACRTWLIAAALALVGASAWADNVAKIGDQGYSTLEAAVTAVKDGETITLLDSVSVSAITTTPANVTIDLNGKTITLTAFAGFTVKGENTKVKNGQVVGTNWYAFKNYSMLTVENLTVTGGFYCTGGILDVVNSDVTTLKYGAFSVWNDARVNVWSGNIWLFVHKYGSRVAA